MATKKKKAGCITTNIDALAKKAMRQAANRAVVRSMERVMDQECEKLVEQETIKWIEKNRKVIMAEVRKKINEYAAANTNRAIGKSSKNIS